MAPHFPGSLHGRITSRQSGEALAGVTVVVTAAPLDHTMTAISDEHGEYSIADLPAGRYRVTFYYSDTTVEADVGVSSIEPTAFGLAIDAESGPEI